MNLPFACHRSLQNPNGIRICNQSDFNREGNSVFNSFDFLPIELAIPHVNIYILHCPLAKDANLPYLLFLWNGIHEPGGDKLFCDRGINEKVRLFCRQCCTPDEEGT